MDCDTAAVVIEIDGACRGNGTGSAKGAIGIFFGEDSKRNVVRLLTDKSPTNQKAEILAAITALELVLIARTKKHPQHSRAPITLQSDSSYVVLGMTEHIHKWEANGYTNKRGIQVTNHSLFKRTRELVSILGQLGIVVNFKHIPRELNTRADALANQALNDIPPYVAPNYDAWVWSNSANHHMCRSRAMFTNYHPIHPLEVCSLPKMGEPIYALGIGTVKVNFIMENGTTRPDTLTSVLHVPHNSLFNLFGNVDGARMSAGSVVFTRNGQDYAFAIHDSLYVVQMQEAPTRLLPAGTEESERPQYFASAFVEDPPRGLFSPVPKEEDISYQA